MTTHVDMRAVVGTPTPTAVSSSGLSLDQIVQLRWEASFGDQPLTPAELAELDEAKRPLIRLPGQGVLADADAATKMRKIGRGRGRERGSPYVTILVGAAYLTKTKKKRNK